MMLLKPQLQQDSKELPIAAYNKNIVFNILTIRLWNIKNII